MLIMQNAGKSSKLMQNELSAAGNTVAAKQLKTIN